MKRTRRRVKGPSESLELDKWVFSVILDRNGTRGLVRTTTVEVEVRLSSTRRDGPLRSVDETGPYRTHRGLPDEEGFNFRYH